MNAQAIVKETQANIIDNLTELEELVAELYSCFAKSIPHEAEFWNSISKEEIGHARLLQTMHKMLENDSFFYNIGRFDEALTNTAKSLLREAITLSQETQITPLQALTTALQIEAMAVESEFYTTVSSNSPELEVIADRIVTETERHNTSIRDKWNAELMRVGKAKIKDESDKSEKSDKPSLSVKYDKKHACVIGTYQGIMDIIAAKKYTSRAVHVGGEFGCKRFLSDMRNAVTNFTKPALFDILGLMDKLGMDRSWGRAILVADDSTVGDCHAIERLAKHNGYTVRLFTDATPALAWLATLR